MSYCLRALPGAFVLVCASSAPVIAQSFTNAPGQIPAGAPFNAGSTENVDFADIDGDGDRDMCKADGGDDGNDQSRLWINRGFEAGGTIGFFVDRTATQFPNAQFASRDFDFVDIDRDGDFDLYQSNTSALSPQSNQWWINMGGVQGGTPGFFQDQTAARWVNIGVNNASTKSSISSGTALPSGGFRDWSCDCVFGDLDNDGDDDLFHSTYGGVFGGEVPSRIFLNDGAGAFEEFNPSGYQLATALINDGNPALWCEGTQLHDTTNTTGATADIASTPLGVELGDLDGDHDIDVLQGSRNETPRIYRNRLSDAGSFVRFRDVTYASGHHAFVDTGGNYEQELGDFENDNDLDIYGLNWPNGLEDNAIKNNGAGVFSVQFVLPNSGADDNEGDFLDYNNDGRLDIYVANFSGSDKLYRNDGAPNWNFTDVSGEVPNDFSTGLGMDSCDVDNDGDYDAMVAEDNGAAEHFYKNVNQIADAIAPRVANLEQAPGRVAGVAPTVVRAHVFDNASWDVTRYDKATLEHSWDGGLNWYSSPLRFAGGEVFRGEIRGDIAGTIQYRARVIDEHGNTGLSSVKSYVASGCTGNVVAYCTSGTSSSGCVPVISGTGTPSATAASGFTISVTGVEGQKQGLLFYGLTGRNAALWSPGSTSFLCVKAPTQRMAVQNSGGTSGSCNGSFSEDWNAYMASHPTALGQPLSVGLVIDAQAWYRDPPAPGTTNLSGALEFTVCN